MEPLTRRSFFRSILAPVAVAVAGKALLAQEPVAASLPLTVDTDWNNGKDGDCSQYQIPYSQNSIYRHSTDNGYCPRTIPSLQDPFYRPLSDSTDKCFMVNVPIDQQKLTLEILEKAANAIYRSTGRNATLVFTVYDT